MMMDNPKTMFKSFESGDVPGAENVNEKREALTLKTETMMLEKMGNKIVVCLIHG